MFGQKIAVIALSALGVVSAQSQNFTIDPNSVELGTRGTSLPPTFTDREEEMAKATRLTHFNTASWCTAQQNNCDTICGAASGNTCDPVSPHQPIEHPPRTAC